jgi:hypothetical protein
MDGRWLNSPTTDTFVLETGFSESGKNVTELAKQQKKKVVFTVSFAFPYQTSRLEVERTSEVYCPPPFPPPPLR